MADAPKINSTDTLRESYPKLNQAIDNANEALRNSEEALNTANQALANSENTQEQLDQIVIEGDSSVEAAQARVDADGNTYTTLKERLDTKEQSFSAQLAQTVDQVKSIDTANALHKLDITNYLGNNQSMHPKTLYFKNQWNGFRFWMGYTPYPNGNVEHENPSIGVSNDGYNWTVPNGLVNPIEPKPNTGTGDKEYNSDAHLVYRSDLDRLEFWWRYYNETHNYSILYRRITNDGVNWTDKECMYDSRSTGIDIISPAIIYEDGKYKMWGVGRTGALTYQLAYTERTESGTWSELKRCNVEWDGLRPWHGDVIKTDKGYEHVMMAYPSHDRTRANLYHFISKDNETFSKPVKIMNVNSNPTAFDSGTLYRSSLLKIDDTYFLYYSARGSDGTWGTSVATGTDVRALNGYYNGNLLSMKQIKEIIFDNMNSFINKNSMRMWSSAEREFYLKPDDDKKYTMMVTRSGNPNIPTALRVGYVYFDKAQDLGGAVSWHEGAIRYNGANKKHEGYDGNSWLTFDRFVDKAPSTYTDTGVKGDYAVTNSYLYVCYYKDRWARIPLETGWS